MVHCTVAGCGKEFKGNAGLSSHMIMVHRLQRNGQPLSEQNIEQRKAKTRDATIKAMTTRLEKGANGKIEAAKKTGWHSPEARKKAAAGISLANKERWKLKKADSGATGTTNATEDGRLNAHYAKLAERGIFRCPECSRDTHKKVDFTTALQLGKHRRFKHNVVSPKRLKAQLEQEALQAKAVETDSAVKGRVPCPQCPKTFVSLKGLNNHLTRMHNAHPERQLTLATTSKELINGNGSTQGTTDHSNGHRTTERRDYSNDATYVAAIAVSNLAGQCKSLILAASDEYDLPPRQLARRVIIALSEHYSS